jgi:hypothetical protein
MATDDNNAAAGDGNGEVSPYELLGLTYEIRILVESIAAALEGMHDTAKDPGRREQFNVLRKLLVQGCDALEALQAGISKAFKLDQQVGHA